MLIMSFAFSAVTLAVQYLKSISVPDEVRWRFTTYPVEVMIPPTVIQRFKKATSSKLHKIKLFLAFLMRTNSLLFGFVESSEGNF